MSCYTIAEVLKEGMKVVLKGITMVHKEATMVHKGAIMVHKGAIIIHKGATMQGVILTLQGATTQQVPVCIYTQTPPYTTLWYIASNTKNTNATLYQHLVYSQ